MRKFSLLFACLFILQTPLVWGQEVNLDAKVAETDVSLLPVPIEKVVVRGYDGDAPPPTLQPPARKLFYGYGVTAYYKGQDTLMFFKVLQLEAIHKGPDGSQLAHFNLQGSRYNDAFKSYFLNHIDPKEKKNIYFTNVYLKDKKGHYFKLEDEYPFCTHCD